jgi:predicted GIY-YIG superfamily endonuclease
MGVMDALVDPRDNKPRYVGVTDDVSARFFQHIQRTDANGLKSEWIQELKAATIMLMTTLETAHAEVEAKVQETSWIHHSLHLGMRLYTQHMPTPLHLKTGAAKARMTSMLSTDKSHVVDRDEGIMLTCSGWGKVAIIEKVWKVKLEERLLTKAPVWSVTGSSRYWIRKWRKTSMQGAAHGNRKTAINRPEASITSFPRSVLARSGMLVGGDLFAGSHASQLFHQVPKPPPVEERR